MTKEKVKKSITFVLIALLLVWLGVTVYKLVSNLVNPTKMPIFFGYSSSLVVSGSMEPTLSTGDMVVCKAQESYKVNDIIIYYNEQEGAFIVHRIIGTCDNGFITKGDFNSAQDPQPVKLENIQGKVIHDIPHVKTVRDIAIGALLVLLVEHGVKLIVIICKAKSKKGEKTADEKT